MNDLKAGALLMMMIALLGAVVLCTFGAWASADLKIMQGVPFHTRYIMAAVTTILAVQLYRWNVEPIFGHFQKIFLN